MCRRQKNRLPHLHSVKTKRIVWKREVVIQVPRVSELRWIGLLCVRIEKVAHVSRGMLIAKHIKN